MAVDYEYVTIDVDLMVHPKAIAAGIEAMGLWLWAVAWSHKTGANGKIPRHVVSMAWGGPPSLVSKLAKRLVTSGLWLATDDGWTIWNYGKKNQSAEEKERRREQGRERMRKLRERKSDAVGDAKCDASHPRHVRDQSAAPVFASGSDLESRSEEPTQSPRATRPDFAMGTASAVAALEVFEAGAAKATGQPFALTRAPYHGRDICAALNTHSPPDVATNTDALRWLPIIIATWVRARRDGDPTPITPGKLLDWLNAGRPEASQTRGRGGGPKGDRQGLDGWTPPTGTDFFGGDS